MPDQSFQPALLRRTSLRLSVQYAMLYTALVLLVFLCAYLFSRYEMRDTLHDRMKDDAASFQRIFDTGGEQQLRASVDAMARVHAERRSVWGLFEQDGTVRAGSLKTLPRVENDGLVAPDALGVPPDPKGEVTGYWIRTDKIGRWTLVQGYSDEVTFELLEALVSTFAFGLVALLGLGLVLGNRVGHLTEDRVSRISDTLKRAASGDFSARVAPPNLRADDLGQVETGIDLALEKIENLVAVQKQITVDVAHDLRSPLQRLRLRLERLEPGETFEDDKAAGLRAIDDIDRTFNALLTIADLTRDKGLSEVSDIPVNALLQDLRDLYEPAVESAGMVLEVDQLDSAISMRGNRSLLLQMLGNLVENSVKYCAAGAHIVVGAAPAGDQLSLSVRDDGPGMSQAFLATAFDRFTREDPARQIPGNGLGLSLVKAIAQSHSATVSLRNLDPGLSVVISGLDLSS